MIQIQKELDQIAEKWTEPEYRQQPELSYSNLSTYERLGYNGLDHLFDKIESPSLTFGSTVDSLITGGEEEFHNNFIVLDINITDSGMEICNKLVDLAKRGVIPYADFNEIPEALVSQVAKETGFWKADKWDKIRYREVLKTGNITQYFNACMSDERKIIDTSTYNDAIQCVKALKTSSATMGLFADNDELSPVRRYYQLKFRANIKNVGYRSMMDLILVNYKDKIISPYDLKTCGIPEWDFESNFLKFHYYTQARLYYLVLKYNLDKDDYFKDFKVENFRFIVINRKSLTPLVWEFPLTKAAGTLVDDKGNEYRDPLEIGSELRAYLDFRPAVPNGINADGINTISCLKRKE